MMTVNPDWATIIVLLGLFALVMAWAGKSLNARKSCSRSGGWGRLLLIALVVVIGAKIWSSYRQHNLQQQPATLQMEQAEMQTEQARHDAEEAARRAAEAAGNSIQHMWEQLNKPRIDLTSDGGSASMEASDGTKTVTMEANPETGANITVAAAPLPPEAPAVAMPAEEVAEATTAEQPTKEENISGDAAERESVATGYNKPSAEPPIATTDSPEPDAKPRPAWVDDPPKRVGEVWREVVVAGDYETIDECYKAADDLLCVATWEHVKRLTGQDHSMAEAARGNGDPAAKLVQAPWARMQLQRMGVGIDTIRRDMVPEDREYLETVERSFGPMKKLYTQLEFMQSVDRELRKRWEALQREERLLAVGGVGGLIVGGVGLAYGLLKVDTWTKGYYTKRLFLGVPAAIIGLIALAAATLS